jgi:hypothetical protein
MLRSSKLDSIAAAVAEGARSHDLDIVRLNNLCLSGALLGIVLVQREMESGRSLLASI